MTLIAGRIPINTPPWVFALLAYFVWQGILSLKPRTLPAWRVLIVPTLFIAMGLSRIVLDHEVGIVLGHVVGRIPYLAWLVGALLFAPLALVTGPRFLAVDRRNGRVTRAGSPVSLIRNVSVFALQYGVAAAAAMNLPGETSLKLIGHAVSRAEAGYIAGRVVLFLKRYRSASGLTMT